MSVTIIISIFMCTWFMINHSISGQIYRNNEASILDEVFHEQGIQPSLHMNHLKTHELRLVIMGLKTKYDEIDGKWRIKYNELYTNSTLKYSELNTNWTFKYNELDTNSTQWRIKYNELYTNSTLKYNELYTNSTLKYNELNTNWTSTYAKCLKDNQDLNETCIEMENIAKRRFCSRTVISTMESFSIRGVADEYGVNLRKEEIDTKFGMVKAERKNKLKHIMNTICFITDFEKNKMKFENEWIKLKGMSLHIDGDMKNDDDMEKFGGNTYMGQAIADLAAAKSIDEACQEWKKHTNVWGLMRTQWKTKLNVITVPNCDEQILKEVTESLKHTVRDIAIELSLTEQEKNYTTTLYQYGQRTKSNPMSNQFRQCAWVCHKSDKQPIKKLIASFKNLPAIKEHLDGKSHCEVIEAFCEQYDTLNRVISLTDFHRPDLKEFPNKNIKLTKEDIQGYISDVAKSDKILAAALQIILSLNPGFELEG